MIYYWLIYSYHWSESLVPYISIKTLQVTSVQPDFHPEHSSLWHFVWDHCQCLEDPDGDYTERLNFNMIFFYDSS